jgi:steroid 5-alpha reductase family enzyme
MYLNAALCTAALQVTGWAVASALRTETFYDVLGGLNFMVLALLSTRFDENWTATPRTLAVTWTFVASRAWLLTFLAWRGHERGGDSRFDPVLRPKKGPIQYGRFLVFWILQGVWVYCLSLPMLYVNNASSTGFEAPALESSLRDQILLAGFILGVVIEVFADVQKAMWVKAGRIGGFCTDGIWSLSRHPNYFGEMSQWACCWLLALSSSSSGIYDSVWWVTALSPLFTFQILLRTPATGVAQANGKGLKRYYESEHKERYVEYRASTSILLPMVGYKHVPAWLKRTVCLDLERYEYKPKQKK